MNANIEKLLRLPVYQRILILVVLLLLIVGGATWFLFIPQNEELRSLQNENQRLDIKLQQDQRIANNLPKFKAEYQKMKIRLEEALTELPNKQEIPSLLTSIASVAKDSGLDVVRFQPGAEQAKGFYAEVPVSLKLVGSFHQTAAFSYAISQLPRIVNLTDISLVPGKRNNGQMVLRIDCKATTFRFVENAKAGKGKKK